MCRSSIHRRSRPALFASFFTDFLAALLAGTSLTTFFAAFLAPVFLAAAFLAAFFAGDFLAAFSLTALLATFLTGDFLDAFLAGLGSPETWQQCGENAVVFAQGSIMDAIGVKRGELLQRNVEYHLKVAE